MCGGKSLLNAPEQTCELQIEGISQFWLPGGESTCRGDTCFLGAQIHHRNRSSTSFSAASSSCCTRALPSSSPCAMVISLFQIELAMRSCMSRIARAPGPDTTDWGPRHFVQAVKAQGIALGVLRAVGHRAAGRQAAAHVIEAKVVLLHEKPFKELKSMIWVFGVDGHNVCAAAAIGCGRSAWGYRIRIQRPGSYRRRSPPTHGIG